MACTMVALGDRIILDGFGADPTQILTIVLLCLRLGSRDIGGSIGVTVYLHFLCVWIRRRRRVIRHGVFGLCATLPSSTTGTSAPAIRLALSLNGYIGHEFCCNKFVPQGRGQFICLHEAAALMN